MQRGETRLGPAHANSRSGVTSPRLAGTNLGPACANIRPGGARLRSADVNDRLAHPRPGTDASMIGAGVSSESPEHCSEPLDKTTIALESTPNRAGQSTVGLGNTPVDSEDSPECSDGTPECSDNTPECSDNTPERSDDSSVSMEDCIRRPDDRQIALAIALASG